MCFFFHLGCGGDYSGNEGQIRSPNFPNNYPGSNDCGYRISVQEGFTVLLTFTSFDLEQATPDSNCRYDYITVSDQFYTYNVADC